MQIHAFGPGKRSNFAGIRPLLRQIEGGDIDADKARSGAANASAIEQQILGADALLFGNFQTGHIDGCGGIREQCNANNRKNSQ